MESSLAVALINKGRIVTGTEITAKYRGVALGCSSVTETIGDFVIFGAVKKGNEIYFDLKSTRDGLPQRVPSKDILMIDGMEPLRFAESFDITESGETVQPTKKRGRKPLPRGPDGKPIRSE